MPARLGRLARHSGTAARSVRRRFTPDAMLRIEQAIGAGERLHRAEIRFAIEPDLDVDQILRGTTPRTRALQLFGELGIWDTEENVGILIYVLWADHAVEIIADRAAQRAVSPGVWVRACEAIVQAARSDDPVHGIVQAIDQLSEALAPMLPYQTGDRDELPNLPLIV